MITLRLRGLYLGLTTWFVAEALRFTISNTPEYTRGMLGLAVDPFPDLFGHRLRARPTCSTSIICWSCSAR